MKNKIATKVVAGAMAATLISMGTFVTPSTAMAASSKTVTVTKQSQLDAALKDKKVTSIVIKTSKGIALKVKDGNYSKKSLIVSSPKATIKNYGDFKKIEIRDSKAVYDRGEGNNILVKDPNSLKLVAGKETMDAKITITSKTGDINLVNNGDINKITINGKSKLTLTGKPTSTPTVTSNAKGAEIITNSKARIALSKEATLTVKSGAKLTNLTTKSDATININKGANINKLNITGNASKANLKIDGTVGSLEVNSKADISITGSTKSTLPITNNVEGAKIESSVKSDLTMNAPADITFNKGAEGSKVTAGNTSIKLEVTNNTSEAIKTVDSTGKESTVPSTSASDKPATSGGSSSSSSSSSGNGGYVPPVSTTTITPVISVSGGGVLCFGAELKASATNSKSADVKYTYAWYCEDKKIGDGEVLFVDVPTIGKHIKLVAKATINNKEVTGSVTTKDVVKNVIPMPSNEVVWREVVPVSSGSAVISDILPSKVPLWGINDDSKEVDVTWEAPEGYTGDKIGTYMFTGTVDEKSLDWVWNVEEKTVRAEIILVGENTVDYTVSAPTGFKNVDVNGKDTSDLTNENQKSVEVNQYGFNTELAGSLLKMNWFLSSNEAQADAPHAWVGLTIDVGTDVKNNLYYGRDPEHMELITEYEPQVASKSAIILWVKADELVDGEITRYIKLKDGDVTPIIIGFRNIRFKLESVDEIEDSYSTKFNDKPFYDVLPDTLTFTADDGKKYDIRVWWETLCDDPFMVGEYDVKAHVCYDGLVEFNDDILPTVKFVVNKGEYDEDMLVEPVIDSVSKNAFSLREQSDLHQYYVTSSAISVAEVPDDEWSTDLVYEDLEPGTKYYVWARLAECDEYNASVPFGPTVVTTLDEAVDIDIQDTPVVPFGTKTSGTMNVRSFLDYVTTGLNSSDFEISNISNEGNFYSDYRVTTKDGDPLASVSFFNTVTGNAIKCIKTITGDAEAVITKKALSESITEYTIEGCDDVIFYSYDQEDDSSLLVNFALYGDAYEALDAKMPDIRGLKIIAKHVLETYVLTVCPRWTTGGLLNVEVPVNVNHYDEDGNTYIFNEENGFEYTCLVSDLMKEATPEECVQLDDEMGITSDEYFYSIYHCKRIFTVDDQDFEVIQSDVSMDDVEIKRTVDCGDFTANIFGPNEVGNFFEVNGFRFLVTIPSDAEYNLTDDVMNAIVQSLEFDPIVE